MESGESKEKEYNEGPREFQREVAVAVDVALATPGALLQIENKEGTSKGVVVTKPSGGGGGAADGGGGGGRGSPGEPWSARSTNSDADEPTIEEMAAQQLKSNVLKSKQLENALHTVERAVMQNLYHSKQLRYRGLPSAIEVSSNTHMSSPSAVSISNPSSSNNNNNFIPPPSPLSPSQDLNSPLPQHSPSILGWSDGGNHHNASGLSGSGAPPGTAGGGGVNDQRNPALEVVSLSEAGEPKCRLLSLFDFICPETRGRTVSSSMIYMFQILLFCFHFLFFFCNYFVFVFSFFL
jgi:hypothetical protein